MTKTILQTFSAAACVYALVGCAGSQKATAPAPEVASQAAGPEFDPVKVAPSVYSLMHEDERVRILEMKMTPGQKDGHHAHPAEAVYFISGGKGRVTMADGQVKEMEIPSGGVMSHEAWEHTVENIGETAIHAIIVERKPGGGNVGPQAPAGKDAATVAPSIYTVMHDDERVRILEMKMAPGQTDGHHAHPAEAVYFISGGKGRVTMPDGQAKEMEIPSGGVMSHEAWEHTVENIGESTIHAIIVELKV